MTEQFGPYEVIDEVGAGRTGRVYKARHTALDRLAAVKVLSAEARAVAGQRERLRAEAALLAELDHPNIVTVYQYAEEAGTDQHPEREWLAEQWVDGASLHEILGRHHRLTPEQALGVVRGAVSGLAYAHDRGVVHRDVSSGNILADLAGTSMLVDFGLAAPAGSGGAVGTPAFISPEAATGGHVDKPADVYSAAAVLYLLLTGGPVFPGDAVAQVQAHRETPAPALTGHGPELADLMARSLHKDPANRPPDAAAFLDELEDAARRRYGAAWLERASIAALVTEAGVAGVAATTGAAGPAQSAIAQGAQQAARVTTSTGRRLAVVGVGVLVALAAATGVVLAANNGDSDRNPGAGDRGAGAESTGPSEPEVDPVVASVPDGKWRLVARYVSHSVFTDLGRPTRVTWTFDADCTEAAACGGSVASTSGKSFTYRWDGRGITVRRGKLTSDHLLDCVDVETQELIARKSVRLKGHQERVLRLRPSGPDTFKGKAKEKGTLTPLGACAENFVDERTYSAVISYVLTRRP